MEIGRPREEQFWAWAVGTEYAAGVCWEKFTPEDKYAIFTVNLRDVYRPAWHLNLELAVPVAVENCEKLWGDRGDKAVFTRQIDGTLKLFCIETLVR